MISYGQAFVVGWLFLVICRIVCSRQVKPWNFGPLVWGAAFVVLNLIATF